MFSIFNIRPLAMLHFHLALAKCFIFIRLWQSVLFSFGFGQEFSFWCIRNFRTLLHL